MKTLSNLFKENVREYGMLIALIVIMVYFQFATDGTLMKPVNITNLVLQNSYIIIMALGMLLVIIAGWIDLSVGSVAGFIGAVAAVIMVRYHQSVGLAFVVSLLAGALVGAFQGYWVAYVKIPAFIVTLAGMLIFKGLNLAVTKGESVGPFPETFQKLSSGFIPDYFHGETLHITTLVIGVLLSILLVYLDLQARNNQRKYNFEVTPFSFFVIKSIAITAVIMGFCYLMASYKGLPNILVILFILIVFYTYVTERMVIGRRIYAMGGNEKAAKLSGVNTARLLFYSFVNMGILAGLGGLVFAARLNSATPKAGAGMELDVIAAVYIGGASASGGIGTVIGAVVGAFVIGVMNNGMSILGIGVEWQQVIKGMVLLLAVFFDIYSKNKNP